MTGPRRPLVETLEGRQLMSVAVNAAGWTVVTPSASARRVYVSSSRGSDGSTGLSASSPVKSLAVAANLVRGGTDDQLLLARGDTWTGSFPQWAKSGRSASEPILIGTYGTGARPTVLTGTADGFVVKPGTPVNHVVLQGIAFEANGRNPARGTVSSSAANAVPTGLKILGPSTDVTVEDASFRFFKDNAVVQGYGGATTDVTLRLSTITDAYSPTGRAQGLYSDNTTGLTLDGDVFDHNGWNATIANSGLNVYSHNVYTSATATGLTVTNSIIANASFAGIMARGGGTITNNLILNSAAAIVVGNANGANSTAGGVRGRVDGNVILGDHGLGSSALGEGIEIGNTAKGAAFSVGQNIIAGDTQNASAAIVLAYANATKNPADAVGLNGVTIAGNTVYNWYHGVSLANFAPGGSGVASLNGLTVRDNQFRVAKYGVWAQGTYQSSAESFAGDTYVSTGSANAPARVNGSNLSAAQWRSLAEPSASVTAPACADPTRTAATFAGTLGLSKSADAFVAAAAGQSSANWNPAYTAAAAIAYVRAGFATSTTTMLAKFTGTTIGTAGSYGNKGNTAAKATDGNLSSYFDAPTANGAWVGLDLGSAKTVRQIKFAPRSGYAARLVGGRFEASNSSTFAGAVTVATASAPPTSGTLTTVVPSTATAYRYWRYVSPAGGYGNIAEFQLFG